MAAKWVQKIKDRLAANPLHYSYTVKNTETQHLVMRLATLEGRQVAPCVCARCGGNGKKVPLYAVTNYGNEFNHCYVCGEKYT
jgi:hypothetical protein